MKNNALLFALLLALVSCEETINVELGSSETRLVVDALIGYNENDGAPLTIGQVKLTLTTDFFDEEVPPAENANVRLIDEETGSVFPLTEIEPGIFRDGFPALEFGKDYTLEIVYQGEIYRATERLEATGKIENVEQGDGFLFDKEKETEVIVTFTDIPDERNYYLFVFGFQNYLVTDDEFYQNGSLTFSYFYEDLAVGDVLTITLLGINQQFANYVNQALVQSDQDGGGFSLPPGTVRGNVINTTDQDNFPFGYFSISEFDIVPFTVE